MARTQRVWRATLVMMLLLVATTGRVWASEEVEDESVADVEDESVETAQLAHLVIRKVSLPPGVTSDSRAGH
jgi:hypothetical protein